ncbi:MAG: hypothetical protein HOL16_02605 [Alphaproteobacteria bacterium]|jgi:hypothetical protein|nr:hypothetical protein [Alphaproteobacteria bacterium]
MRIFGLRLMVGVCMLCFSALGNAQGGDSSGTSEDEKLKRTSSVLVNPSGLGGPSNADSTIPTWSTDKNEARKQQAEWAKAQVKQLKERMNAVLNPTDPKIIEMHRVAREGAIKSHYLIPDGHGDYMPNPAVFGDRSWVTAGSRNHKTSH